MYDIFYISRRNYVILIHIIIHVVVLTMRRTEQSVAFLFQSRYEIGQYDAILARVERIAGGSQAALENALMPQRLQENQCGDSLPRG